MEIGKDGTIIGALISGSPTDQKLPAIVDLYGTRGGLNELRAALLASRGFVTLALAYFNYKDLPNRIDDVELEYFDVSDKIFPYCTLAICATLSGSHTFPFESS